MSSVKADTKVLPCGHVFHYSCLRSWLEQSHSCPVCRASLAVPHAPVAAADRRRRARRGAPGVGLVRAPAPGATGAVADATHAASASAGAAHAPASGGASALRAGADALPRGLFSLLPTGGPASSTGAAGAAGSSSAAATAGTAAPRALTVDEFVWDGPAADPAADAFPDLPHRRAGAEHAGAGLARPVDDAAGVDALDGASFYDAHRGAADGSSESGSSTGSEYEGEEAADEADVTSFLLFSSENWRLLSWLPRLHLEVVRRRASGPAPSGPDQTVAEIGQLRELFPNMTDAALRRTLLAHSSLEDAIEQLLDGYEQ